MKKLLILPLLVLLTACVQYYSPETAMEDGVYYAEDDPKYMVFQGGDPGAVYYPWASLDYFYLGYGPYYPYPIYPYYTGFPFGMLYGWSPWYLPDRYYGYHPSMYGYNYYNRHHRGWRPYNGYCANYGQCGKRRGNRTGYGQNRFVGQQNDVAPVNDKDIIDGVTPADNLENMKSAGSRSSVSNGRFILTLPPGYASNQGMTISRNEATKTGRDKVDPIIPSANSRNIIVSATPSVVTAPASAVSNRSAPSQFNRPEAPNTQAPSRSRSSGMPAPSRSSGVNNRSRSGMSAPRSRPSKSRSSRPVRDLD